jgi:hypothetical protein
MLQPQFAPDLLPSAPIHLPEVFFWAAQVELPKFVKPFQLPGHAIPPTQPRLLDAPPRLEMPASEPSAVTIPPRADFTDPLKVITGPVLPIQTSATEGQAPRTGVSAEPVAGDPTTLLSLAQEPSRLREFLSVPPGNQLGQVRESGRSGQISAALAEEGSGGNGGAGTQESGRDDATGSGREVSGAMSGGTRANLPASSSERLEAPNVGSSVQSVRATAMAAAAATRIEHPATGVFDVVVQSGGVEGFPESAGVLSGRPVYSAFIQAGGPKDWILQYCIPAAEDHTTEISGPVVRLGTASPLSAPYPRVTLRPAVRPRPGRYVMVHGAVTAAGRFEGLRILGTTDPYETEIVLSVLEQWEFRPAMRDGAPLKVEVLLAIPAE